MINVRFWIFYSCDGRNGMSNGIHVDVYGVFLI